MLSTATPLDPVAVVYLGGAVFFLALAAVLVIVGSVRLVVAAWRAL